MTLQKKHTFTHLTETERGEIDAYVDTALSLHEFGRRITPNVTTILTI